ncbi:MAG: serine/threonine protein phosphatase, partial [Mycolicibacter arupensis]
DSRGELVQISFSQSGDKLSCRLMTLQDLRPPAPGKSHLPTLTNLPPAPPEPGTDCRAVS